MGTLTSLRALSRGEAHTPLAVKPEGCLIKEALGEERASWLIPAKRKINFLMVFAGIWLVMSSFGLVGVLHEVMQSNGGDEWIGVLMLGVFLAVGVAVGYIGLRMAYTELLIRVGVDEVVLTRKFFKKMWDKKIPREQVGRVWLSEAYRQNERPVYQIEIENEEGKNLRFGSNLSQDEKRWLLGGMREMLVHTDQVSVQDSGEAVSQRRKNLELVETKSLKLERIGHDGFRVTRVYRSGPWLLAIGLVMVLAAGIGMVLLWQNFKPEEGTGWIQVFDVLFSGIPFLMALISFLVGVGMLFGGRWVSGRRKIFEFGKGSVTLLTQWRSTQKTERFDRDSFHHVESAQSGHINNDPRFKLTLIGEKESLTIFDYENSDVTELVTAWVELWMRG
jgi:hypothetical protein